jgi:hypothetical protein
MKFLAKSRIATVLAVVAASSMLVEQEGKRQAGCDFLYPKIEFS